MGWKLMCSVQGLNPLTLAATLQANIQNCTNAKRIYDGAFILISPRKTFLPTDEGLTLAEYYPGSSPTGVVAARLTCGPAAGYYTRHTDWTVVVAQGAQELNGALLAAYGKAFAAMAAGETNAYPNDCLGYCIYVLRRLTGLAAVAGLTGPAPDLLTTGQRGMGMRLR